MKPLIWCWFLKRKSTSCILKLKYLVVQEPLVIEILVIINKVLSQYRQHEGTISYNRRANVIKYLSTLLDIKYYTAVDLYIESNSSLVKWFIAGYMRLTFDLAQKRLIHNTIIRSFPITIRTFGLFKTSVFILGIASGFFLKKGYIYFGQIT